MPTDFVAIERELCVSRQQENPLTINKYINDKYVRTIHKRRDTVARNEPTFEFTVGTIETFISELLTLAS